MRYSPDFISLIFLAAVYICFILRGTRYCAGRRWFNVLLAVTFGYLILILSSCSFNNVHTGLLLMKDRTVSAYIYLTDVIIMAPFMYLYFTELCEEKVTRIWQVFILPLLESILLATNELHHLIFYFDSRRIYRMGRMIFLLYAVYLLYFILIAVKVYRHRVRLGRTICITVAAMMCYLTALQILQLFFTNMLLQGISCSTTLIYLMTIVYMVDNHYDDVTGIHNKSAFFNASREIMKFHADETYLIVRMDIINFQDVNEQFGYKSGDAVLKHIAQFLQRNMSDGCELGYLGADDFAACIPEKEFMVYAMHSDIKMLLPDVSANYDLMYSVGIYRVKDKKMDISLMLDRAEFALMQMQKNCREHLLYFDDDMERKFLIEKYMVHEMYHALNNNCFEICIQPIISADTHDIVSGEAILRWHDSRYGIIPDELFRPLFERNAFITEIDKYIIERVCRYVSGRKAKGGSTCPISVNVTKADIQDYYFVDTVERILSEYGMTAEDIVFEVTERAFDGMDSQIIANVRKMHDLGYRITMDDFGSGYSNFNNFSRMPVDMVKADISFITDMEQSQKGITVMQNIIRMTRDLEVPMIIDGVDNENQYKFLKQMDCERLQGFYFSRPVSLDKFSDMLNGCRTSASTLK